MSTRCLIAIRSKDGYESIYCHHDGYPSGVGKTLLENYLDPEKIAKLFAAGDTSNLEPEIEKCAFYRLRGETEVDSNKSTTFEELRTLTRDRGGEYLYVYLNGGWAGFHSNGNSITAEEWRND